MYKIRQGYSNHFCHFLIKKEDPIIMSIHSSSCILCSCWHLLQDFSHGLKLIDSFSFSNEWVGRGHLFAKWVNGKKQPQLMCKWPGPLAPGGWASWKQSLLSASACQPSSRGCAREKLPGFMRKRKKLLISALEGSHPFQTPQAPRGWMCRGGQNLTSSIALWAHTWI